MTDEGRALYLQAVSIAEEQKWTHLARKARLYLAISELENGVTTFQSDFEEAIAATEEAQEPDLILARRKLQKLKAGRLQRLVNRLVPGKKAD
jgi:hypothetical protein